MKEAVQEIYVLKEFFLRKELLPANYTSCDRFHPRLKVPRVCHSQ